MDARTVIAESAKNALNATDVGPEDRDVIESVKGMLVLLHPTIGEHVTADDTPGLFWPVLFVADGKFQTKSALLALDDRLIVAWTTGMIRVKNHAVVIRYDSVTSKVQSVRAPDSDVGKETVRLLITAGESRELLFLPALKAASILPLIDGMMAGTYKVPVES